MLFTMETFASPSIDLPLGFVAGINRITSSSEEEWSLLDNGRKGNEEEILLWKDECFILDLQTHSSLLPTKTLDLTCLQRRRNNHKVFIVYNLRALQLVMQPKYK